VRTDTHSQQTTDNKQQTTTNFKKKKREVKMGKPTAGGYEAKGEEKVRVESRTFKNKAKRSPSEGAKRR
jgi:hypothetical protein